MPLSAGEKLGAYEILAAIGAGGMGEVYRARDTRLCREVAVKVITRHLTGDAQAVARFERESRTVAALSHPNVLAIHDVGSHEGAPFVVFELLTGDTLRGRMSGGRMSRDSALGASLQIARGLAAAHARGIVHRDLKPENVFVTTDGTIKLLDFGLARAVAADDGETRAADTSPGTVLGTMAYMSPEQARGLEVGPASDVFSFGAMLYEMIAGRRAFGGATSADVLAAVVRDDPPSLVALDPATPAGLLHVVARCLAKDPAARYETARGIVDALEALSGAASQSTPVPSSRSESGVTAGRRSIAVLPFDDISAEGDNEFFADGLTDEVIADLSKVAGLRVISRTSVRQFKGQGRDLAAMRAALHVQFVLEGSVRKAGQKLRITVQLIDVETDSQVWSEKYQGTLDDIFEIQEQVARAIVAGLKVTLTPDESRELAAHGFSDARAYELYLRARAELQRFTPDGLKRALLDLDEAIARAGETELLLGLRGDALWQQYNIGMVTDPAHLELVTDIARRIETLRPGSTEADRLHGCVALHEGRFVDGLRALTRAMAQAAPDSFTALLFVMCSAFAGKPDAARPLAAKMISVSPLDPVAHYVAGFLAYACDSVEQAVRHVTRAYELDPYHSGGTWMYASILTAAGRVDDARQACERIIASAPDDNMSWLCQTFVWGLDANSAAITASLTDDRRIWAASDFQYALHLAECFAMAGDRDQAFEWLDIAVTRGAVNYPFLAERNPLLANLRDDSRFAPLMTRVEAVWRSL